MLQDKWSSIEERTQAILDEQEHDRQRKAQEAAERHAQQSSRLEDLARPETCITRSSESSRVMELGLHILNQSPAHQIADGLARALAHNHDSCHMI